MLHNYTLNTLLINTVIFHQRKNIIKSFFGFGYIIPRIKQSAGLRSQIAAELDFQQIFELHESAYCLGLKQLDTLIKKLPSKAAIIFNKIDRFSRNPRDFNNCSELIKKNDLEFHFIEEGIIWNKNSDRNTENTIYEALSCAAYEIFLYVLFKPFTALTLLEIFIDSFSAQLNASYIVFSVFLLNESLLLWYESPGSLKYFRAIKFAVSIQQQLLLPFLKALF